MATIVSYNGSNFSIPANREPRGWGSSLTSFLLEVAEASLTPSGGNYRLQADLNLGSDGVTPSSFGLVALYYKSVTANIAQSGQLRLARTDTIAWRNQANGADLALGVNSGNRLEFGGVNIPTVSSTDTLTHKTLTSPVITSPTGLVKADVGLGDVDNTSDANKPVSTAQQAALDLKANLINPTFDDGVTMLHESTPSNPSSGRIRVYPKSDNRLYTLDSSGVETVVGSGAAGGFVNYITNPDAESATTGWATYADAAASTPADGTGGSPNVTWTRNTSSPIRGNADFAFAKDAANRQGQGVAFAFTISTTDRSKKCQISFDYDTSAANYAAGDLRVYIYDVTGAALITPQTVDIPKGTNTFITTFDTTTSTSYRLILHVATINPAAYTVDFDNFVVNAGQVVQGAAISEWQSYTPTGPWSNTTYTGRWKRNASDIELIVDMAFTGIPASGSLIFTYAQILNGLGLTLNTNNYPNNTDVVIPVGTWAGLDSGSNGGYNGIVSYDPVSAGLRVAYTNTGGVGATVTPSAPFSWNTADNLSLRVTLPIAEWAGNGTVNLGPGAQVEYVADDGTNDVFGPLGAVIPTITAGTGFTSRTFSFQYPWQQDDIAVVEIRRTGQTNWEDAGQLTYIRSAANDHYGIRGRWSSSTVYQVDFGNRGYDTASGFGSNGNSWNDGVFDRWRVRKAKASAPVGFGKSNSNEFGLVAPRLGQRALTVTGSNWTTTRAVGIYYQDQDGNHRLKGNIAGTVSGSSRISYTITISGVIFRNVTNYNQAVAAYGTGATNVPAAGLIIINTGNIQIDHATATTGGYFASFDVELESRPSWA